MFGLKEQHINAINNCFIQYTNIKQVIIYGSRAKGNYRPGSDIDLTIIGNLTYAQLLQLENQLDDLLLPYKIDLSLRSQISNSDLLDHIERVGQKFYEQQATGAFCEPEAGDYKKTD